MNEKMLRRLIRNEIKGALREQDPETAFRAGKLPPEVDRHMKRLVNSVQKQQMTRARKGMLLNQVVKALGLTTQDLMRYTQIIKKGL